MTIEEFLESVRAIPALVAAVEKLTAEVATVKVLIMRNEGEDGEKPPITWQAAKGKKFVGLKEAAYLLDISESSVRRLLERDLLKFSSGTRHKKISVESLEAYGSKTIL